MATVNVTVNGQTTRDVISPMPQPVAPVTGTVPDVGWVEISTNTIRGSVWSSGNGPPTDLTGNQAGDMYLDTDTGDIYMWDGDSWNFQNTFAPSTDTPAEVLAKLITVDGAGSGLDADLLDGQHGAYYSDYTNLTNKPSTFPPTLPIPSSGVTGLDAAQATQDSRLTAVEGVNATQNTNIANNASAIATETTNRTNADTTLQNNINLKADIASPTFTGDPKAPTPSPGDNDTSLATTAFVTQAVAASAAGGPWAPIASPTFTGDPKAPTPATADNDTSIATTAYVKANLAALPPSGIPEAPTDGITYGRKNAAWSAVVGGAIVSDTPPVPPLVNGQFWLESDTGALYAWWDDGNSQQWVMVSGPGGSQQTDYVRKIGDSMTGNLTIDTPSWPALALDYTSGGAGVTSSKDGVARWQTTYSDTAWTLDRYNDAGVFQDSSISIARASGAVSIPNSMVITAPIYLTGPSSAAAGTSSALQFYDKSNTQKGYIFHDGPNTRMEFSSLDSMIVNANSGSLIASASTFMNLNTPNGTITANVLNTGSFNINGPAVTVGTRMAVHYVGASTQYGLNMVADNAGSTSAVYFMHVTTGVGSISITSTATGYNTSSDERLKDFGADLTSDEAFAVINADPVRHFNWKVDGSPAVGWSAQHSYSVSPDLASPPPEDPTREVQPQPGEEGFQPWGMDQGKRTPYLWAAVSGLLKEIESLKARIAVLEGV